MRRFLLLQIAGQLADVVGGFAIVIGLFLLLGYSMGGSPHWLFGVYSVAVGFGLLTWGELILLALSAAEDLSTIAKGASMHGKGGSD